MSRLLVLFLGVYQRYLSPFLPPTCRFTPTCSSYAIEGHELLLELLFIFLILFLELGHLGREIDALGGEMGRNTDRTGIQFRMLNMSKGPAVRALRVQADRKAYRLAMQQVLQGQANLEVVQVPVERLLVSDGGILGVQTGDGTRYKARAVILTTGTFLKGLIHIGQTRFPAGRAGEQTSEGLSASLMELGFTLGRLKTGTPPRLDGKSIDFSGLTPQYGDDPPPCFSCRTPSLKIRQVPCHLTYTNRQTGRGREEAD